MRYEPVCYHGRSHCRFCGSFHTREPLGIVRRKPRCPACGRFTKRHEHCARCVERHFFALTLFAA